MYDKRNYECIINPDKSQHPETKEVLKSWWIYFYSTTCPSLDTLRWKVTIKIHNFGEKKTLLPLKLVVKFGQHLCMMILSNLLCYFLHQILWYKITICRSFKSVPLLFFIVKNILRWNLTWCFFQICSATFYIIWNI